MSRKPSSSPAPVAADEAAFIKQHLAALAQLRTAYPSDYVPPLGELPRRPPVVPIEVLPPPEKKDAAQPEADKISITIKSLKPPLTFPLQISPLDPISTIKLSLASTHPRAPPAEAQRLLHKGKALADPRLAKEYGIEEGAVLTLMVRPGVEWSGEERAAAAKDETAMDVDPPSSAPDSAGEREQAQRTPGGQPIPTLTLSTEVPSRPTSPSHSPSPSLSSGSPKVQIHTIPINTDILTSPHPGPQPDASTSAKYHATIANDEFWSRLLGFLRLQFEEEADAVVCLEEWLLASKGALSAGEIARIRDRVGVSGMGGL